MEEGGENVLFTRGRMSSDQTDRSLAFDQRGQTSPSSSQHHPHVGCPGNETKQHCGSEERRECFDVPGQLELNCWARKVATWEPGGAAQLQQGTIWTPAEEKLGCVGRESNPGQLLGRQLCSPLYHQRSCLQPSSCSCSSQTPHPPPSSPLHVHFLSLLPLLSHSASPTDITQIPPYWEATSPKKHTTNMTWSKQGSAFPSL